MFPQETGFTKPPDHIHSVSLNTKRSVVIMRHLEGLVVGRFTVISRVSGGAWLCRCECGNESHVMTGNLLKGSSRSCGCLWKERITTHGLTKMAEYTIWKGMRSRCLSKSDGAWRNYGGRGIAVCREWDDFMVFLRDMGMRPSASHDLDREDNDKGYSKDNCRWITHQANLNNRRTNRRITYDGKCQTIAQWSVELGIKYRTLNNRLNRGWSTERAFSEGIN